MSSVTFLPPPSPGKAPKRHNRRWIFFALFVVVGLLGMVLFGLQAVRDYRIAYVYLPAQAEILSLRMVQTSTTHKDSSGRRSETQSSYPEFTFKYRADGAMRIASGLDNHDGKMAKSKDWQHFTTGSTYPCWYDPAAPDEAVLLRKTEWFFYLGLLIPGAFIFVGGLFLLHSLGIKTATGKYSTPEAGTRLRYRLKPVMTHQATTGCLLIVVVVLGFALAGIWMVPWGTRTTQLISPMFSMFIVVAAIEGFIIYHFARAVKVVRIQEPSVEIDDEPLHQGQSTKVVIFQAGPLQAERYRVQMLCEQAGTGKALSVKEELVAPRTVQIADASDQAAVLFTAEISIPTNGKLSDGTPHASCTWVIRVTRLVAGKTELVTDFPFRVVKAGV